MDPPVCRYANASIPTHPLSGPSMHTEIAALYTLACCLIHSLPQFLGYKIAYINHPKQSYKVLMLLSG